MLKLLFGSDSQFSGEHRLLNAVFLLVALIVALGSAYKLSQSALYAPLFMVSVIGVSLVLYLLSRLGKQYRLAWGLLAVSIYGFSLWLYVFRGGLDMPMTLLLMLLLLALVAVTPRRTHKWWLGIHLGLFAVLSLLPNYLEWEGGDAENFKHSAQVDQFILICFGLLVFVLLLVRFRFMAHDARSSVQAAEAQAMEDQAQLEANNRQLTQLFSVVSHDLRSPLHSLKGYLEVLLEGGLSDAEDAEVKRKLRDLTQATAWMLDQLLVWSRTQLKGFQLRKEDHELDAICADSVAVISTIAEGKGVEVQVSGPSTLVYTDRDLLSIVIRNLTHNAVKYSHAGSVVEVRCLLDADRLLIEVRDSGVGMTSEELARCYGTGKKGPKGTMGEVGSGLGSVIVKDFVHLLGGELSIDSEKGKGTSVRVLLPIN